MTERQGAEIDYCPKCYGERLARRELDKITEKTMARQQAALQALPQVQGHADDRYCGGQRGYRRRPG